MMKVVRKFILKLQQILLLGCLLVFIQSNCSIVYSQDKINSGREFEIKSAEATYSSGRIYLKWKTFIDNFFDSLQIFREDNLSGQFNSVEVESGVTSRDDSTFIIAVDTLITPRTTYRYYTDLYDQSGSIISTSDTLIITAYDLSSVPLPQNVRALGIDSLSAIRIQWEHKSPQDILSLKVFRSENYDSNYVELTEVLNTDTFFVDRTAEPMKMYFYYLVMTDPFGNYSLRSARVFGSYKSSAEPLPPYDLTAAGTSGGVKLQWTKPDDFILSYHIYRNDGIDASLSLIASIKEDAPEIIFYDTSKTLKGDMIYAYAIQSENTSGRLSLFTDTIYARPDIEVLLRSPSELKGYDRDSVVQLYWENLYESTPTLDGYLVYKRESGVAGTSEDELTPLIDSLLSPKQNNFIDTLILRGKSYEYFVQAVDIYGNKSPLGNSVLVNTKLVVVLPPAGIKAQKSDGGILISWDVPIQQNIKEYKIYRYQRGEDEKLISSVPAKEKMEYLDKNVSADNLYFYYLKSVNTENLESSPSKEIGIRNQ